MKRHYALLSVTGISVDKLQEYLTDFLAKMQEENDENYGATVYGIDESAAEDFLK